MADLPRLNGIIGALESGRHAFSLFAPAEPETAIELQGSDYDGVVFEGEHRPWDPRHLRDTLQYLLNRGQIAKSGSVAPKVTPTARIPASGVEMNQFLAKQALDIGCYGVMWPHISTVEEAYNAVAACRYQRMKGKPLYEPAGIRGDGPVAAARYWGVSQQEYYSRADVWPLAPEGEILVVIQIEDTRGIENLDDMLDAMAKIVDICKRHNVVVGHPHVTPANAERVVEEGYRYLMCAAPRSFAHLEKARAAAGLG
jgi:4-hydroxy-2-oxoheptanedioate aldolase